MAPRPLTRTTPAVEVGATEGREAKAVIHGAATCRWAVNRELNSGSKRFAFSHGGGGGAGSNNDGTGTPGSGMPAAGRRAEAS